MLFTIPVGTVDRNGQRHGDCRRVQVSRLDDIWSEETSGDRDGVASMKAKKAGGEISKDSSSAIPEQYGFSEHHDTGVCGSADVRASAKVSNGDHQALHRGRDKKTEKRQKRQKT